MEQNAKIIRTLDQAIDLARREPGRVAAFTFHMEDLQTIRAALAAPAPKDES